MATILLVVIYLAFIGLGIPDSLFGTAWPAIYQEFSVPVSYANFVSLLISGGTVAASLLSARLINRFGTGKITALSTVMTAAALLGFSLSGQMVWLCLWAIPLGLGAGAVDSALNNYVALHYKASHMSFLHCFYGIGVSMSPYLMSLALGNGNWRQGYQTVFYVQLGIALITIAALPLWKQDNCGPGQEKLSQARTLSLSESARQPLVPVVWLVFLSSCAIEYTCGLWGSTFLVNEKHLTADVAAEIITYYYIGMTLGRFLSGLLANRLKSWRIIHLGQGILLLAIVGLFLFSSNAGSRLAFLMIGLGNGPLFPNLIHLTPQNFGREVSQSIMGTQMAASYLGIMLMPALFGLLAQEVGAWIFPYYLSILFILMIGAMLWLIRGLKRQGRY